MHVPRRVAPSLGRRPMFVARPRRRVRPVLLGLALLGLVGLWAGTGLGPLAARGEPPAATAPGSPASPDAAQALQAPAATPLLATFGGLDLNAPTERAVIVGFHEASTPEALEMAPTGRLVDNENTTKFEPPEEVVGGSDYLVMSSRGRPRAATSAVDVVMRTDERVLSPVSGTVTDARTYHLYGNHEDERIEIAPHDQPGLRVVLIHLDGVAVEEGDEVAAGQSVLASGARAFPFGSQVDRYTEPDRWPHVHIEVKVDDDEAAPAP